MTRTHSITPIPTEYKGLLYKSRLEAYWQAFFNGCNVVANYEAKTYQVNFPDRPIYTPDFFLTLSPFKLIEIKPDAPTEFEVALMTKAIELSGFGGAFVCGHPNYEFEIYLFGRDGELVDPHFSLKFKLTMKLRGIGIEYGKNIMRLKAIVGGGIWQGFEAVKGVNFD